MADDLSSKATEFMKKVLTVGVGTLFLTEESLRGLVSEFKLPKELLGSVLESANKTRKEFLQNLSHEIMGKVSEKIDPAAFVQEFLSKNEIDLHIRISVSPKKSAVEAPAPAKTPPEAPAAPSGAASSVPPAVSG